jgi:RimJ/RimL family protein N-acetyltransferase
MMGLSSPLGLSRDAAQAPLATERLFLRMPEPRDVPELVRSISDPLIARFVSQVRYPYTPIDARRFIAGCAQDCAPHVVAHFLLIPRAKPRMIAGGAGFVWKLGAEPEIGYWLASAYRGRGLASEAVRALLGRIFTLSPAQCVRSAAYIDNIASRRVLERAGFRRTGRGMRYSRTFARYRPVNEFVLSRRDWEKRGVPA